MFVDAQKGCFRRSNGKATFFCWRPCRCLIIEDDVLANEKWRERLLLASGKEKEVSSLQH